MSLDPAVDSLQYTAVQISEVTIELPATSSKWIQSIDVRIDGDEVAARLEPRGGSGTARRLTAFMEPSRVIVLSLQLTAHLRYKNLIKQNWRSQEITVHMREFQTAQHLGNSSRREWKGTYGKTMVTVGLTTVTTYPHERPVSLTSVPSIRYPSLDERAELTPTTDYILRDCPRFRILVMGKTGVGKSRLVNKTFGVNDAVESNIYAGYADINKEILSKDNAHFILHDSKGFEHGDDTNVKTVQQFINERNKMPLVKDKLHAIWLCIDIPVVGGRLLETGIEQFLKLKIEGKLGNVPVIAVFTKYDLLVVRADRMLESSARNGQTREAVAKVIEKNANAVLKEKCIDPFEKFVDRKVPHITVSSERGYEARLADLIQLTYDHVHDYFADASVVSAMAQRLNPMVNIQASIAVGRRKYWQRLASSVNFPGKNLQQCLDVIHSDIVAVWRFNDPNNYLSSSSFKALMTNIVASDLDEDETRKLESDPRRSLAAGISLVAGIAGIVSALSGPAAPIVVPIAAGFVLAKWAYDVYQMTTVVLRRLMTYIIDLTLVLQNLFWLQLLANEGQPISRRLIKVAARAYHESNMKQTLRFKIDKHLESVSFGVGPDVTMNAIVELLDCCTIDSAEMLDQMGSLPFPSDLGRDEGWEEQVDGSE